MINEQLLTIIVSLGGLILTFSLAFAGLIPLSVSGHPRGTSRSCPWTLLTLRPPGVDRRLSRLAAAGLRRLRTLSRRLIVGPGKGGV